MNNSYLGIYDSGIGGLTVVKALKQMLPAENVVYLADSKNMPYGSKTQQEIITFSKNNIDTLKQYNIKAVLIACNTSDSLASEAIRQIYDLPIFGVIEPAARKAVNQTKNKKIGILATEATINSKAYEKAIHKIDQEIQCTSISCPKLVPIIEQGNNDDKLYEVLMEYLSPALENGVDTVILGCTHYDVLYDYIKEKYPDLSITSSSRSVIEELEGMLKENDLISIEKDKDDIYLSTSDTNDCNDVASTIIEGITIKCI